MSGRLIRLGHSPDPDDAFMFYALAQNPPLIDTRGYTFQHVLQDIQTLNQRAMKGESSRGVRQMLTSGSSSASRASSRSSPLETVAVSTVGS